MNSVKKLQVSRPNDCFYDPVFTACSAEDYEKAKLQAKYAQAKYAICPIFDNMFSDLQNKPRTQIVMRRTTLPISYQRRPYQPKSTLLKTDPNGAGRFIYFSKPIAAKGNIPPLNISFLDEVQYESVRLEPIRKKNKKIQTQYRESSAQTSPWEPDFIVTKDSDPELLKLDFLKWGAGLPAGMHEVTLILRARMIRAWEKTMPPVTDSVSLAKRKTIIEAIEQDQWRFRDQEIQDIQDLRMQLLEKMLNELHDKSVCRAEKKMKDYSDRKNKEKEEKLAKIRHHAERAQRKLNLERKRSTEKDIITMYTDKSSDIYGPRLRFGKPPSLKMKIVEEHVKNYRPDFKGVEYLNTLPTWLNQATKIKDCSCLKMPGTRLCVRETKWTTPILKQLHEELKDLREPALPSCNLRVKVVQSKSEAPTPEVEGIPDQEEENYQAIVSLQAIIKGRATHMTIYKGRHRCKELIEELKSTHSLAEDDRKIKFQRKVEVKVEQRTNQISLENVMYLREALNELSGTVVGTLLDFLTKELQRLLDERRIHALCLLAEKERHRREAAEAGRRQVELQRRKEHDEFFKQEVKAVQDTTDIFLQDIITEGIDFASRREAEEYVRKLAEKIDENAYEAIKGLPITEQEELVANLVHELLVPETEKQIMRERIRKRQENHLKIAHEMIHKEMDALVCPELDTTKVNVGNRDYSGEIDKNIQSTGNLNIKDVVKQVINTGIDQESMISPSTITDQIEAADDENFETNEG